MQDSPSPLVKQEDSARLTYEAATLFNAILWGISGIVLILIWIANPQVATIHSLMQLYLPIGLIWIAGLAWFLNAMDARLPTIGLIVLMAAWIINIQWSLSNFSQDTTSTTILLEVLFHLVIIGWLPVVLLDVLLIVCYRIHWIMMIALPIAYVMGGIVLTICLVPSLFTRNNLLLSVALVGFGYGAMGFIGGGVTLFAVADAKLRHSTASASPLD